MAAQDLVTLPEVLAHLTLSAEPAGGILPAMITEASEAIVEHCKRELLSATYTELVDGGRERLRLKNRPVTSITSITDHSVAVADRVAETVATYRLEREGASGLVILVDEDLGTPTLAYWGGGKQRWEVVYVAGWALADMPGPVKMATKMLVATWFENRTPGVHAEKLGDWSAQREKGLPTEIARLLSPFVRVNF